MVRIIIYFLPWIRTPFSWSILFTKWTKLLHPCTQHQEFSAYHRSACETSAMIYYHGTTFITLQDLVVYFGQLWILSDLCNATSHHLLSQKTKWRVLLNHTLALNLLYRTNWFRSSQSLPALSFTGFGQASTTLPSQSFLVNRICSASNCQS